MLPKTPAKGMRDFLPKEFALRQKILSTIQSTYESYGFCRIETPSVENLSLLTSKQGGDNEKLIFKILKRGEKLENATYALFGRSGYEKLAEEINSSHTTKKYVIE